MTKSLRIAYDVGDMADEELTKAISLRLSEEDTALLEALAARTPMMKKLAIARQALRLGLAEIQRDPSALFRVVTVPADRKSEPKPKKR